MKFGLFAAGVIMLMFGMLVVVSIKAQSDPSSYYDDSIRCYIAPGHTYFEADKVGIELYDQRGSVWYVKYPDGRTIQVTGDCIVWR